MIPPRYGNFEDYAESSGTSIATATTASLAGLLLAYRPGLFPAQLKGLITSSADPDAGGNVNAGHINAEAAMLGAYGGPYAAPSGPGSNVAVVSCSDDSNPAAGQYTGTCTITGLAGTQGQLYYEDKNGLMLTKVVVGDNRTVTVVTGDWGAISNRPQP